MLFVTAAPCPYLTVSLAPGQATAPTANITAGVLSCNGLQPSDFTVSSDRL